MSDTMNLGGGEAEIPEVPSSSSTGRGSKGFMRSAPASKSVGFNPQRTKGRLFGGLDFHAGYSQSRGYEIGKDDRMSDTEAWQMMVRILKRFGLDRANEGDMFTFIRALYAYHTINSASVLQPGRSSIRCLGNDFDFMEVMNLLGDDARRFFRAYADEVREENKRILACDPTDEVMMQLRGWIIEVAYDRGLQRFPDLAHDSASACSYLTASERAAVAGSTRLVLSTNVNTADSMVASTRTQNADKFDSTAGTSVQHAEGSAGSRRG